MNKPIRLGHVFATVALVVAPLTGVSSVLAADLNLQGSKINLGHGSTITDDGQMRLATDDWIYLTAPKSVIVSNNLDVTREIQVFNMNSKTDTGSGIWDNGDLHIETDDNLRLDATTTYLSGGLNVAGTVTLPDDSITSAMLAAGTVTGSDILDGTVGAADLASGLTISFESDITVGSGIRVGSGSTPDSFTALADDSAFVEGKLEVDGTSRLDGAVTITGVAEGTASLTQTAGDHVITDGDLTVSGGEISATAGATTGDAVSFNGNTTTTGQVLAMTYDGSTHTSGNVVELADNDAGVDFAIAEDGATTITGSAEGTSALTITAGDAVITDGDLTLSGGEVSVVTDDTTTDAFTINGASLTTGQTLAMTYDASTHTSGNVIEVSDNDAGVDFAVAEDGATTITGSAEGTAALTVTAGDIVATDGDVNLTAGDLTVTAGAVAVTADDTTADAVTFTGNTLTTGQTLAMTYDASTHTSGNVMEIADNDAGVDFAVAEDGATTITGSAEGTSALTVTAGDVVVTDGDLTVSGGEVSATTGATTGDGVTLNGNTLTTGQTLAMTYDASTHTSGNVMEIADNDAGVDFAVAEDGATTITGSAIGTAALTVTAGNVVLTSGHLTQTAGTIYRSVTTATAGAGNGETLDTTNGVNMYDAGGASRTGVILEAPTANGQTVYISNISDAAENITFAAAGTSNVANGTSSVIGQNEAMGFVASTIAGGALYWFPLVSAGN